MLLGLALNSNKSEVICKDPTVKGTYHPVFLAWSTGCSSKEGLFVGLGDVAAIDASLHEKILALQRIGERFLPMTPYDNLSPCQNCITCYELLLLSI